VTPSSTGDAALEDACGQSLYAWGWSPAGRSRDERKRTAARRSRSSPSPRTASIASRLTVRDPRGSAVGHACPPLVAHTIGSRLGQRRCLSSLDSNGRPYLPLKGVSLRKGDRVPTPRSPARQTTSQGGEDISAPRRRQIDLLQRAGRPSFNPRRGRARPEGVFTNSLEATAFIEGTVARVTAAPVRRGAACTGMGTRGRFGCARRDCGNSEKSS